MLVPLPERLRAHATAIQPERPVHPRDSATIAVVREGASELEVFLMRRQASMAFAAGMYVFPGGGVHDADSEAVPWAGPSPEYFAGRFGCEVGTAHALVVAAARETFEETGVLVAGPDEGSVVGDTSALHEARLALENHELSFAELLNDQGLMLRADLLGAWSHWITPSFEPRRYNTRFFVAVLPEGQRIDSVSTEADHSTWVPISQVLESVDSGRAAMMPPTSVTCRELSLETVSSVLEAASQRLIRPIEPRVVEIDGELWLETDREEDV